MDLDFRALTGLVAVASGAAVVAMSYVGAYLMGRHHERRDAERAGRLDADRDELRSGRLLMVEGAVTSVSRAVERLADAQRIALLDRVRPASSGLESKASTPRVPGHNTPS
jgi:hypothetical protein